MNSASQEFPSFLFKHVAVSALLLCAFLCHRVTADVYMHSPRGSNDRNCERDANRRNGNRLFDSQNNNAGGYGELLFMLYFLPGTSLYLISTLSHSFLLLSFVSLLTSLAHFSSLSSRDWWARLPR